MKLGILSDTHDHLPRTERAVKILQSEGADALAHCGDLTSGKIVAACSILPFYFVFGNHDGDMADILRRAADEHDATCLEWGGEFTLADKRIAMAHGHIGSDVRKLLKSEPDYLLFGHTHVKHEGTDGEVRRINPGALFRAQEFSVAVLDLELDEVEFFPIPR